MSTATRERPILFSGPMVPALLAGRKTVTRRAIKPQPPHGCLYAVNGAQSHALCLGVDGFGTEGQVFVPPTPTSTDHRLPCPYGRPGDSLWVREGLRQEFTTSDRDTPNGCLAVYAADDSPVERDGRPACYDWERPRLPSIHMPRWACRLALRVEAVGVERVQEVTREDALAEGSLEASDVPYNGSLTCDDAVLAFRNLWDQLNARRGLGWDANPWVWVVRFSPAPAPEARP